MKCKEFNNKLATLTDLHDVTEEMQRHMERCALCRESYAQSMALFGFVAEEKRQKVSPFITTRIMAQLDEPTKKPWAIKPAFVSVMSAALVVLGFFSASLFSSQDQVTPQSAEIIASEYFFSENPGSQLEEIWLNTYQYE